MALLAFNDTDVCSVSFNRKPARLCLENEKRTAGLVETAKRVSYFLSVAGYTCLDVRCPF
jgi:hypothetical protein